MGFFELRSLGGVCLGMRRLALGKAQCKVKILLEGRALGVSVLETPRLFDV